MKKLSILLGLFACAIMALFSGCETTDEACEPDCGKPRCAKGQAK